VNKYNDWHTDLKDSTRAIQSIKDTVLPSLISGSVYSIENAKNEILIWMDMYSGIDMVRKNNTGLQGIASRVQFGQAYNTFTIRSERHTGAKTEMSKRLEQIAQGYFYPAFTLQAYFDDRIYMNLLSIAVIKTVDLYAAIAKGSTMLNGVPRVGHQEAIENGGWLPAKGDPYPVTSARELYVRERHLAYVGNQFICYKLN
jgi:hypothetical protein